MLDSTSLPHPDEDVEQYRRMIDRIRDLPRIPEPMAETVSHFLFGETTRDANGKLVDAWIDRWQTYPGMAVYREVDSWLDRADVTSDLLSLDVPSLFVHGEEDTSIDLERARPTAEALDADLAVIPRAGHSSNVEQPSLVNDAIRDYLETVY